MKRSFAIRQMVLSAGLLLSAPALARVNPLRSIEQQIQKPNMLLLFDVSTSMMMVPGVAPADFYEVPGLGEIKAGGTTTAPSGTSPVDRHRRVSWTELP